MSIVIVTLNCAEQQQPLDGIARLFETALPSQVPDIVVFGGQEVAPVMDGCFGWLEDYTKPVTGGIENSLARKYPQANFSLKAQKSVGAINILIYSRVHLDNIQTSSSAVGMLWSSLKGAAAVRLTYDGAVYTFMNSHLPAHAGPAKVAARNEAYTILANTLKFGPQQEPLYMNDANHHLYVFGDLNYRSKKQSGPDDSARGLLSGFNFENDDELTGELAKGTTLWGLHEAPIKFEPTFKYYMNDETLNHKRAPSWPDRILYSNTGDIVQKYNSYMDYTTTDHRPVYLVVSPKPVVSSSFLKVPTTTSQCPELLTSSVDFSLGAWWYLTTTKYGIAALGVCSVFLLWMVVM